MSLLNQIKCHTIKHTRKGRRRTSWNFELLERRNLMADLDDSISEAFKIGSVSTTPAIVNASVSPDTDVNMISFDVLSGQVIDFDIDTQANGPDGLGSYILLFDSQGKQLASNDDGAAPGENKVGFDSYLRYTFPTSGTFYLGTSNYNNVQYNPITGDGDTAGGAYSLGNYSLIVQALPIDINDTFSEAFSLGTISSTPAIVDASIVTDIDVNMVSFFVVAGQIVDFDIDTTLNGSGGLGSFIRLFNSQGQVLAFNDDDTAPSENTLGFDAYLRYTFTTGGTYYLGVSNFNNVQYNPSTGNGDTASGLHSIGSYQLTVQTAGIIPSDLDDTISEATSIGAVSTPPINVSGSISPDTDVNMVRFTVLAGQVVDFDIDTSLNGPGGLGSYIRLFDGQGTQLASNDDGAAPGENSVGFDAYLRYTFAAAGTFYLGVSNFNNVQYDPVNGNGDTSGGANATGAYQLIVQALPIDTNDTFSEAFSLGTISSTPAIVDASIVTDIDVNMVSFLVVAGQIVDFDIDTTLNGSDGLGSFIRLFNSQGQELAFNDDGTAPGENTLGFDAYLRYTFTTGGTYYLGLSNFNNVQYNPSTGNGDTEGGLHSIGSYQLTVQTAGTIPSDLNDTISEAASIGTVSTPPIIVSASISPDTDVNLVRFTVSAGQVVDFDIDTALNGSGGLGSYIRLFNGQGTQLASNDDGAAPGENSVGFDAYLRYTFAAAGTFYLGVSNFNNVQYDPVNGNGDTSGGANATGAYQLIIVSASETLAVSIGLDAIPEKNGTAVATVSRTNADISQPLVVNLMSSDINAASVPASVVIPSNQLSVNFTITALDDQIVSGTRLVTIVATANGFRQGSGTIRILDSNSDWHNVLNPNDVDDDNNVSPLDVLAIVNYLNIVGAGPVPASNPPPYLDVNSDNFVSPLDALFVINFLNSQSNRSGEGERLELSVNSAVPLEFLDDYFTNYSRQKSLAVTKRAR